MNNNNNNKITQREGGSWNLILKYIFESKNFNKISNYFVRRL